MDKLIEALQIFLKYDNPTYPTWCEHDVLHICINSSDVSEEDKKRLNELGFLEDKENEEFISFKYGSA